LVKQEERQVWEGRTLMSTCERIELDGSEKESSSSIYSEKVIDSFSFLWNKKLGSGVIGASNLASLVYGWEELDSLLILSPISPFGSDMFFYLSFLVITIF
jgi:hypothetical protein